MPFVCQIGSVDYSAYLKGLSISPGGDGLVGSGTLTLDAIAGLTIVPMMDVKVWQTYNAGGAGIAPKGRLFGGHINSRTTSNFGNTKTWSLNCWDYNVVLDKVVRDIWWAGSSRPVVLAAGTFAAQIASLFDQVQKNGGASYPPVLIDVSAGVVNFTNSMLAVTYPGGHKLSWYIQQLCAAAQVIVPAIRPHFYLGVSNTSGISAVFDVPVLWIYDGASAPGATADFSDTPVGAQKPYYGIFKRVDDASVLTQRIQSVFNDSILTSYDSTSQATYPNPYINHGGTGNSGYWQDDAIKDTGSPTNLKAQAALDRLIASKANPKETFTFETTERVMPGDYINITNALEGISVQKYRVAQVRMLIEPPETIVSTLTVGNRRLLLFDTGEEEVAGVPIEGDHVPPLAPTAFSVTSNTWNRNTNMSDLVFLIGASPSPDAAGYVIFGIVGGQEFTRDVLTNLTPTISFGPNLAYSLQVLTYDRNQNDSPGYPTIPITGTTAIVTPDPPTALIVDTTWSWGILGYYYDGLGHALVSLIFTPPAVLPEHYILQGWLGTDLVFETRWPVAYPHVVTSLVNVGDTYTFKVWSEVHDVRSTTPASLGPLKIPSSPTDKLPNPGFEFVGAGAAGTIRGWTNSTLNGGTAVLQGTYVHSGASAVNMTTSGTFGSAAQVLSDLVTVEGATYALKVWARKLGASIMNLKWTYTWYATDGTTVLGVSTGTLGPLTTSYVLYPATATAAAGAAYYRLQLEPSGLSMAVYADDVVSDPQSINADIGPNSVSASAIIGGIPSMVNVKSATYGAMGDGTTDDTSAISSAMDAANTQGIPLYFPPGTYLCGQIAKSYALHIIGAGKSEVTILSTGVYTSGYAIWRFQGSIGSSVSVGTNVAQGGLIVNASTTGIVADDLILLADNTAPYPTQATRYQGQLVAVASITDSTHLVLKEPAYAAMTSTPFVQKVTPIKGLRIEGLSHKNTNSTTTNGFIRVEYGRSVYIDIDGEGCGGPGIDLHNCYDFDIVHNAKDYYDIVVTALNQYGYGVQAGGACNHGRVYVRAHVVRHAFTAGGTDAEYGEPQNIDVWGHAYGCTSGAWDVHAQGFNITFHQVTAVNCHSYGIQIRCKDAQIEGGLVQGCTGGVWLLENAGRVRVKGLVIDRVYTANDNSGSPSHGINIAATAATEVTIEGCEISNIAGCGVRISGGNTDIWIMNNRFRNVGIDNTPGARSNINFFGACTRVRVHDNIATDTVGGVVNKPLIYGVYTHTDCSVDNNYLYNSIPIFQSGADIKWQAGQSILNSVRADYALTVPYAATVTINAASAARQQITLTGNLVLNTFTNPVAGQVLRLVVVQDATGSRIVTSWPGSVKFAGGAVPTLTSAANKRDTFTLQYDGTNWYEVSRTLNM